MLTQINIKNFAIIDELDLPLNHGMTVVTGETGAGKSIMIDAIELALGKRANNDIVKADQSRADITIEFNIDNNLTAKNFLIEHDLEDDDHCLIRRTIHQDGRSKSYINGIPVTQQLLRELSDELINIHGQHEFQTLANRQKQLVLLDDFAGHETLLADVKNAFKEWEAAEARYATLKNSIAEKAERTETLTFQLKAFHELALQPNEAEELDKEQKQLAHADTLIQNIDVAQQALTEDENSAAQTTLYRAIDAIQSIEKFNDAFKSTLEMLNAAAINIDEASSDLRHQLQKLDLNPERLALVDERLATIYALAKKHHVAPDELLTLQEQMENELDQLAHSDEELVYLEKALKEKRANYDAASKKLSVSRKKSAEKFAKLITEKMQQLGMKGGLFEIEITPRENNTPCILGNETITFLVSANRGQPPQPLAKVASGGELSRISLAIQVIAAKHSQTPTLIFDEVDAGIGGGIAEIVGTHLNELSQTAQTLCITHLPQVAAKGHHHLKVSKQHGDKSTTTSIDYLTDESRIEEIARMSGGINITRETLAHAKKMLENPGAHDFLVVPQQAQSDKP